MLTWHFGVFFNLISLYQTYFVTKKMSLFYKITNYWRSFNSAALRIWTIIRYCKCTLIANFVSRNISYVVIYILWTFCYISYINVTEVLLFYMIHLMRRKRFHTTIMIFPLIDRDWAENCKKLSRWMDFSLTHFSPLSHLHTPWKRLKTFGSLTFSGGVEMWHWTKMGSVVWMKIVIF